MADVNRYNNLLLALQELHVRGDEDLNFVEIGTFNGHRAASLIKYWSELTGKEENAAYVGFDLFESMTPDRNKQELSKSTLPPRRRFVEKILTRTGATFKLIPGDTRETVHRFAKEERKKFVQKDCRWNLIYVDGGHSLETVASDWAAVQKFMHPRSIVLFDDYYENKPEYGCKQTIDGLHAPYSASLLDPVDIVPDSGLQIRMVRVHREA